MMMATVSPRSVAQIPSRRYTLAAMPLLQELMVLPWYPYHLRLAVPAGLWRYSSHVCTAFWQVRRRCGAF